MLLHLHIKDISLNHLKTVGIRIELLKWLIRCPWLNAPLCEHFTPHHPWLETRQVNRLLEPLLVLCKGEDDPTCVLAVGPWVFCGDASVAFVFVLESAWAFVFVLLSFKLIILLLDFFIALGTWMGRKIKPLKLSFSEATFESLLKMIIHCVMY